MDENGLENLVKENFLPLLLIGAAVILFVFGAYQFVSKQNKNQLTLEQASQVSPTPNSSKIFVDIEGAVVKPGTYSLKSDSRLKDALSAAGGISDEADKVWVEKNLNLASKVTDGIKIYVPRVGEETSSASTSTVSSSNVSGLLININSATASELDTLSGIGPVTAQKIIDNRPYASISELVSKKAVTQSVFDKIKDKITN